eukprot:TRINITY_DN4387_c0_g1_i6.p1 TRINITY_DN4387_c0_g1~~TRINITY_DN4387_c0_g1_i6.p1  ORF type:complete len:363 (-),score=51.54 TRINITY_DN4387_c0_g1_i6:436-1524(-)
MPEWKEFLPELVCLGVDGLICGALYFGYSTAAKLAQDLTNAPEIPITSGLKKDIETHMLAKKNGDNTSIPLAVISGNVTPTGRTVASAYTPDIQNGVIQNVVFKEHKRNLSRAGFWIDSERTMHQYTNESPFCLTNPQTSSYSISRPRVEVCDWSDAARIDLDTIYDKFEAGPNSIGDHLLGWVQGDLHKGTQITEKMLLKGTNLTAVGELVSSPLGIQIKPPSDGRPFFLVKNSISSLIKEYDTEKQAFKFMLRVFSVIGVAIAAVGAYRYWCKRKQELIDTANRETVNTIIADRENRPVRDNIPEHLQCVVCLGAEREVIILPCGHVSVCGSCALELIRMEQGCPVCRGPIQSIHQAFVS